MVYDYQSNRNLPWKRNPRIVENFVLPMPYHLEYILHKNVIHVKDKEKGNIASPLLREREFLKNSHFFGDARRFFPGVHTKFRLTEEGYSGHKNMYGNDKSRLFYCTV